MDERAYVAVTDCGCVVGAVSARVVDRPESRREISRWLRDGLSLERMEVEEVRRRFSPCEHKEPA